MTIRPVTAKDFPELYTLWKETNQLEYSYAEEKKMALSTIKHNPTTCLIGIMDNKIIATSFGVFNGRRAWLYRLAVAKKYQKRGIGTEMITATEKALKKRGADVMLLWVVYKNLETAPFYLGNGYAPYSDAICLRKQL